MKEIKLSSETVYSGRIIKVSKDRVRLPGPGYGQKPGRLVEPWALAAIPMFKIVLLENG